MNLHRYGVLAAAIWLGCAGGNRVDTPTVFTSVVPHSYVAQRIAGGRFEVYALVKPGQSPHSFSPTPEQMARLSRAAAYFRTGVEFENGVMPKIARTMPELAVVDLRRGVALREMTAHHERHDHAQHDHAQHDHAQHDHAQHDHAQQVRGGGGGTDPHIWLSPVLLKTQAATIAETLERIDPSGRELFRENLQALQADLDSLDAELRAILAPYAGEELLVFHPAFGYFADEYGLTQKAVEVGGKEPSAKALARLIDEAATSKPRVVFVQPQFSPKRAEAIAAHLGCAVAPINPLPEDYLAEMRDAALSVKRHLEKQPTETDGASD